MSLKYTQTNVKKNMYPSNCFVITMDNYHHWTKIFVRIWFFFTYDVGFLSSFLNLGLAFERFFRAKAERVIDHVWISNLKIVSPRTISKSLVFKSVPVRGILELILVFSFTPARDGICARVMLLSCMLGK